MTSLMQPCANCHMSGYVHIKLNVSSYRLTPRLKIKCRRKCKIQAKSFEGYVQNAKTSRPKESLNEILLNYEENPEKWISYENPIKPGSEENKLLTEGNQTNGEKVRIPGIPEDNAEIERCVWEWRPKLRVHYWKAGSQNLSSPAVLFLPGFGVGAFHFVNQLKDLGKDFRVWSIDFIGQGQSLPSEDPAPSLQEIDEYWGFGPQPQDWASELVFSVDLWRQQIHDFVEQVIGEPVYIVGNSLGGFVGLYFTACNPSLVKGTILLNATPFWSFVPNSSRSPRVSKFFPWAGNFPLPPLAKRIMEFVWTKITDPKSIEGVLKQVYVDQSVVTNELLKHILRATEHPAAAAVFASILFAPQGEFSFNESLKSCREAKIPVCLIYGKEDPWVKPLWGRRIKKQVPEALYYEISPAGHCPHSEVPEVVNFLMRGWIKNSESLGMTPLPLFHSANLFETDNWRTFEFPRMGSLKKVQVRIVGDKHSYW